jgi:hypothetical protein
MDAAPGLLGALEHSGLGLAVRQSVWVYPAANVGHVAFVTAFFAAVVVLDLILLGVIPGGAALAVRAKRAAMAIFVLVASTGAVLFIAEASHVASNPVFLTKLAVIGLALLNAAVLGRRAMEALGAGQAETAAAIEKARWAAGVSLVLWMLAVMLGRFIAYI